MMLFWSLPFLPLAFAFPSTTDGPDIKDEHSIIPMVLEELGTDTSQNNEIMDDDDRKQFAELIKEQGRSKRNAYNYPPLKWPNNTLYYQIDKVYEVKEVAAIKKSIETLQDVTCVDFVESDNSHDRVTVWKGAHCNSEIGRSKGTQGMSLGASCLLEGLTVHEFIHALGFVHTHTAPHRDQFITVNTDGVEAIHKNNFIKNVPSAIVSYTPYDYGSILHYPADGFAKIGPTILPKDARFIHTMGSQRMSFYDKLAINKHYNCSSGCDPKKSAKCENGGFLHPRDCEKCVCPAGYGGNLCDERPSGCGSTVEAQAYWQDLQYTVKKNDDDNKFGFCNHWINAPSGTKIEVRVRDQIWYPGVWDDQECSYGCLRTGVEIKVDSDKQATNPRICCSSFFGDIYTSSLNPTPVISHTFRANSNFHLDYRYVSDKTPSAKPIVPDSGCMDSLLHCPQRVMRGFCEDTSMSLLEKRKQCGMSCNLCGR